MTSLLMGGRHLFKVYTPERIETLKREAGLTGAVTKEEILSGGDKYKDVEYVFSTWGMPRFSESEIKEYLPSLKAVFYSAGSVQAFAREFLNCGVRVFSAWGANAIPVAEYTVAQIILANKGFYRATRLCTSPDGRNSAKEYGKEIPGNYNCKVGIIGAGMIGRLVIKMLKAYSLEVLVYDPFLSDDGAKELGVKKATLETIFSECKTISNHVANLPETVGMFDRRLFSMMKKNATFINTGRGAQVVENDLIEGLTKNPDITAVLDVTMPEPPENDSPLYTLQNVFLTPHIAGSMGSEVERMSEFMVEEYRRFINDSECLYEVNLKMLETMA